MNLQDFATLALARAHPVIIGELINRDSLNGWLGGAGIYKRMKTIAADPAHPDCDVMEAFLDSVDYNFIAGTTTGDAHIALLDSLIANESTIGPQLAALRPLVMSRANVVTYPLANTTKQDFDRAHGLFVYAPVIVDQGFCKITTNADCEAHRPQIYRKVTFANGDIDYVRVAGFGTVELEGTYRVQCPSFPELFVDNAYGVVS